MSLHTINTLLGRAAQYIAERGAQIPRDIALNAIEPGLRPFMPNTLDVSILDALSLGILGDESTALSQERVHAFTVYCQCKNSPLNSALQSPPRFTEVPEDIQE